MMLQQRRVESEWRCHEDLGRFMTHLARDRLPYSSLLLFPVNRNVNGWS